MTEGPIFPLELSRCLSYASALLNLFRIPRETHERRVKRIILSFQLFFNVFFDIYPLSPVHISVSKVWKVLFCLLSVQGSSILGYWPFSNAWKVRILSGRDGKDATTIPAWHVFGNEYCSNWDDPRKVDSAEFTTTMWSRRLESELQNKPMGRREPLVRERLVRRRRAILVRGALERWTSMRRQREWWVVRPG